MEETNQWDDYAELYPQIDNELDVPVLLRTALALVEGERFIDVGCGEGGLLDVVRAEVGDAWEVTGFEISETRGQRARERGLVHARSHIERLLAEVPPHCGLVTVIDGHPATLAWLGSVMGQRTRSLGVEHFGETGTVQDLYRRHGIDAQSIVKAAQAIAPGRPIRHLRAL